MRRTSGISHDANRNHVTVSSGPGAPGRLGEAHGQVCNERGSTAIPKLEFLCLRPAAEYLALSRGLEEAEEAVEYITAFDSEFQVLKHLHELTHPLNELSCKQWALALMAYAKQFPLAALSANLLYGPVSQVLQRLPRVYGGLTHLEILAPNLVTLSWVKGLQHLACLSITDAERLPGRELRHLNVLINLRALELVNAKALDDGLCYEALLDMPNIDAMSLLGSRVDDCFMKYFLRRHLCEHDQTPGMYTCAGRGVEAARATKLSRPHWQANQGAGGCGYTHKPALNRISLRGTSVTNLTMEMLSGSLLKLIYLDVRDCPYVALLALRPLETKFNLSRTKPRVFAANNAVMIGLQRPRFSGTNVRGDMRACVCMAPEGNSLADQAARWLAGEILSIPYPQTALEARTLASPFGIDAPHPTCQLCINEPVPQPDSTSSTSLDISPDIADGRGVGDFPLPRREARLLDLRSPRNGRADWGRADQGAGPVQYVPAVLRSVDPLAAATAALLYDDICDDLRDANVLLLPEQDRYLAGPRLSRLPRPLQAPPGPPAYLPFAPPAYLPFAPPGVHEPAPNVPHPAAGYPLPWANPPAYCPNPPAYYHEGQVPLRRLNANQQQQDLQRQNPAGAIPHMPWPYRRPGG